MVTIKDIMPLVEPFIGKMEIRVIGIIVIAIILTIIFRPILKK